LIVSMVSLAPPPCGVHLRSNGCIRLPDPFRPCPESAEQGLAEQPVSRGFRRYRTGDAASSGIGLDQGLCELLGQENQGFDVEVVCHGAVEEHLA